VSAIGSVSTGKGVALSTEVAGVVSRMRFESGARVAAGQELVELDTAVERAQLASAVARRQLAAITAERTRKLVLTDAAPIAQLDNDESQLRSTTKDAEQIQAQIARKTIRAPFAGKVGIRLVNVGQYLNAGVPVTFIEPEEALHVDFTLPQQWLGDVGVGMRARILLGADVGAPLEGHVAAVDPAIDQATRNIKLRADVDNGANLLRPGMFVTVDVVLPEKARFVVVPVTAIVHAPYGDSVFVVEQGRARQQFVRLGKTRGDFVAILEGVKPKQEIEMAGAFKLRNDIPVTVDNTKAPKPQIAPHPENR
jgi:membrane fusion protein (multidrug efflux system)